MDEKTALRTQYAALPVALEAGALKVMLVTSRGTGRWIIPKGQPERKLKPFEVAAKEAYEEAGLVGHVRPRAVGSYRSVKGHRDGVNEPCVVKVFLLEVERQLEDWPEKGEREIAWFSPAQAAMKVTDGGLVEILLSLSAA
jgi:8-oxo-dGTP pyrophosphatase MutT (NUDIX family)